MLLCQSKRGISTTACKLLLVWCSLRNQQHATHKLASTCSSTPTNRKLQARGASAEGLLTNTYNQPMHGL